MTIQFSSTSLSANSIRTQYKPVETDGARKFLSALPRTTLLLSMELGRDVAGLLLVLLLLVLLLVAVLLSSEFTV